MKDKKYEDKLAIVTAAPSGIGKIIIKSGLINHVGAASSREWLLRLENVSDVDSM